MHKDTSEIHTADLPRQAEFNPLYRPYLVLVGAITLAITVIGIPLAIIWVLGVGQWWARHYFDKLECELTDRTVRFRKGILFQVERTIPLENIQDVTFIEGPLLRQFHLATLKFETAGQSAGQAHDMSLVGIIDAHQFRDRILSARDELRQRHSPAAQAPAAAPAAGTDAELLKQLSTQTVLLHKISEQLDTLIAQRKGI
ncbi:PH domain-containing protein [Piscinibacterium candidicorallinum]|uniref:PH domain-containing protein n=1 Tax=Piscinibacterium candidicorallinum TaxID=1793872 RepID=A0ABV7H929_9BURK